LRNGKVVQIVGGTLDDAGTSTLTRFQSEHPPSWYAELYRKDGLTGGHVIALGPGNESAARDALGAWPGGLQYGGGVNLDNASAWLEAGASQVIVTSWVFRDGLLDRQRLADLVQRVGKERLVLDLSCRKRDGRYWVVTDRWQRFTSLEVDEAVCHDLAQSCSEFLIHAVDVEGKCEGIDEALVSFLGEHSPIPMTYAGGIRHLDDLKRIDELSHGRVDGTVGSALDLFGGTGAKYDELVAWNRR
jgi:phosphoribosylformimino-5-aminoimidazole carboxamide ribotide isomerase